MTSLTPDRIEDVLAMLRSRKNQDFDGECHLTNEEASGIIRLITELKEVRGHWETLDRILAETHVENDRPDRVKWEGEWHYGPAATAMCQMMRSLKKLCAEALTPVSKGDEM